MHLTRAAAEVVQHVIDRGKSLDMGLKEILKKNLVSSSTLMEMSYGSCRYYTLIDAKISSLLERPIKKKDRLVYFILVVAAYQVDHMTVPEYAVINEAVNSLAGTRESWAGGLVNGVMRNYLRNGQCWSRELMSEHIVFAFTRYLFDKIKLDWPEQVIQIAEASNDRPPLTLRVNLCRISRESYMEMLDRLHIKFTPTVDSLVGVSITKPMPTQKIPGFEDGLVSVQDESAQLAVGALGFAENLRIMDACAAPGGKTGHLLETFSSSCEVISVDKAERTGMIHQNLTRLGHNAAVINGDLLNSDCWWDNNQFDRVLLDVPCSGSGVIRRHPDIKHHRQPGDIRRFHKQQVSMLAAVWGMLRPDGILLYVTCSIFRQENDCSIETFIRQRKDCVIQSLACIPGIKTEFGVQRLPGIHRGDGFYYCKILKTAKS